MGLYVGGLGQELHVVAQLLADLKLDAQGRGGPVVDYDGILVEPVKHTDL